MSKWGYLARAYAIKEFAYMKATEAENPEDGPVDEGITAVINDIKIILEMAEDNYISAKETPEEYRTIKQCKKWLHDFKQRAT